jgi:hypothetical protein
VVVAGQSAGASSIAIELIGGRVLRLPASTPAASVATLLLKSDALIADAPKKGKGGHGAPGMDDMY